MFPHLHDLVFFSSGLFPISIHSQPHDPCLWANGRLGVQHAPSFCWHRELPHRPRGIQTQGVFKEHGRVAAGQGVFLSSLTAVLDVCCGFIIFIPTDCVILVVLLWVRITLERIKGIVHSIYSCWPNLHFCLFSHCFLSWCKLELDSSSVPVQMCHKSLSCVSHLSAQVSRKCTSYLSPLQQMVLAASFMHYLNIKWEWAGLCCKQTSGEQHGLSLTTSWLLLEICVEVTHGRISLFHSVPVKGRFHLLLWISIFLNTFSHSRRRICSFALTAVAHLGNIFMHEWHDTFLEEKQQGANHACL